MIGRLLWSHERKVAAFCEGRSEQADGDFLTACALPPDPEAARVALAVRRAVAAFGSVDPHFIRAEDAYPDPLNQLPQWDEWGDSLDWHAFLIELEEQLGERLPISEDMLVISDVPADQPPISVERMAAGVYRIVKGRGAVGRTG